MRIRRILLAAPIAVVVLFVAAFFVSRPYFKDRQDALVMASIGEPENLNPVLSTTVSASEIQDFVFDTLLKLDENAQIATSLAKSYELTQTTHLYFASAKEALQVVRAIDEHRAEWKAVGLTAATAVGNAADLKLTKPGTGYQHVLLGWIGPVKPVRFQRWQVRIGSGLTWQGKPVTSDVLVDWIKKTQPESAVNPRVIYAWKNTSQSLEIYTVGADGGFMDGLQEAFAEKIGAAVKTGGGQGEPSGRRRVSRLIPWCCTA